MSDKTPPPQVWPTLMLGSARETSPGARAGDTGAGDAWALAPGSFGTYRGEPRA
jgi:hypothetical protein